jgi:putative flippase GtrA
MIGFSLSHTTGDSMTSVSEAGRPSEPARWRLGPVTTTPDRIPHVIRFGFAGGIATLFQMILLVVLVTVGMEKSVAHVIALIASSQVSFFLSRELTWAERRGTDEHLAKLLGKLARFNGMIAVSMLVNQLVFQVTVVRMQYLLAGALGILAAAIINYTVSDRLIFAVETRKVDITS